MTPTIPALVTGGSFSIPAIGFGTWKLGGTFERDPNNNDRVDIDAIQNAYEEGIRHFDTAEMYAGGYAEELLARATKEISRSSLFFASKVRPENLHAEDVKSAAKRSLERLKTDYIDLYYIHVPNHLIPLEETISALNELYEEKLIRSIGVSNFAVPTLKAAQKFSKAPIVANQVHYNLKFRGPERKELLSYCQAEKIALIAWRPLQYGELASSEVTNLLSKMAQKYSKTPAQIAINWLISQEGVGTLFMTRSRDHVRENLGALGWEMEREDIELLRREYPDQQQDSDRVPLR